MSLTVGSLVRQTWSLQWQPGISPGRPYWQRGTGLVVSVRREGVGAVVVCTVLWSDGSCNEVDWHNLRTVEQEA